MLLTALSARGSLERFVPFDVDPAVLNEAADAIGAEYPHLQVQPVIGDFEQHLDTIFRAAAVNLVERLRNSR